jgi:ParB family chromosome partitioning protein
MGSKFNISDLLNGPSIKASEEKQITPNKMKVVLININDLIPSKENFYSVEDVEELKNSIEMFGIKQNLTVRQLENGKYSVIAGHRRRLASLSLVEEGKKEFEMLPCAIESKLDDIKEQLLLITTNATTRQLTDWEKTQQANKMRELLEQYKKSEKIPGRMRELIAKALNTSPSQVGRMESINNNLSQTFKEEFKKGDINISTAYELSTLPEEVQKQALTDYTDNGSLSIKDVKNLKEETKKQDKVNLKEEIWEQETNHNYNEQPGQIKINKEKDKKISEVPTSIKTIYSLLQDMSLKELAEYTCLRCDGSGFCDYFTECKFVSIEERPKICEKWLNMQAQKG